MPSHNPRIERLRTMLSLEEKRANCQRQLDAIHQQLSVLKDQLFDKVSEAVVKAPAKTAAKATPRRKGRSKRGALKEQILAALSSAGMAGVRVTEIASALGTKAANIHAWFHSTGKGIPGLTKVTGGHYRLNPAAPLAKSTSVASKVSVSAKASAPAKKRKAKTGGTKRGELSINIIQALEKAGEKGLKIKDLAEKIGAKYRNVSVWFVTTGKNYPKVKKVGAAHYKLAS